MPNVNLAGKKLKLRIISSMPKLEKAVILNNLSKIVIENKKDKMESIMNIFCATIY